MTCRRSPAAVAAALFAVPSVALAHTGVGPVSGLAAGLAHPFSGLDHLLAMLAIGLLAGRLGGRAVLLLPLGFVLVVVPGAGMAAAGLALPLVEGGIALSLLLFGAALLLPADRLSSPALALLPLFALFHGYAHGLEMPADVSGLAYGSGFLAATAGLHALGVVSGLAATRLPAALSRPAFAAAGIGLLVAGGAGLAAL